MIEPSQLSRSRRPKWHYVAMGVGLIAVAVVLTVAWQILAAPESAGPREVGTARAVMYFFGSLLFLLLIGGLVLIVILFLREVRLNERQSNFVSAVTHELKTPVASLRLYLDTLEYRDLPPERRLEFYRTMRQDLDRLNRTINNVLDAAMYTDHPVREPRPVDLARIARRAIELTRTRHQLPAEALRYDGADRLLVAGDAQALETAVVNLLDNAIKYSKGGVVVRVEVWGDGDGQAHLQVSDRGMGMGRTQLPFIFTRFYRIGSEVRRGRTGTGLGLFIVRAIVKGHRGTITADSPGPGRGSVFTITLPGLLGPEAQAEAEPEPAEEASGA